MDRIHRGIVVDDAEPPFTAGVRPARATDGVRPPERPATRPRHPPAPARPPAQPPDRPPAPRLRKAPRLSHGHPFPGSPVTAALSPSDSRRRPYPRAIWPNRHRLAVQAYFASVRRLLSSVQWLSVVGRRGTRWITTYVRSVWRVGELQKMNATV